jgi:hypothetical protein
MQVKITDWNYVFSISYHGFKKLLSSCLHVGTRVFLGLFCCIINLSGTYYMKWNV